MKSGYKILWTDHALIELEKTINILKVISKENSLKIYLKK